MFDFLNPYSIRKKHENIRLIFVPTLVHALNLYTYTSYIESRTATHEQ